MLLVLTSSADETANYLCTKLIGAGVRLLRLDTDTCARNVTIGYARNAPVLRTQDLTLRAEDVRAVWLRRPKPVVVDAAGDDAQRAHVVNEWGEALEGYLAHISKDRWMNYPAANVVASHKLEQITRALRFGLTVPDTLLTQSCEELESFWRKKDGRVVAKPLASGYLERPKGVSSSIYTSRVGREHLHAADLAACPTLFQEEVAKAFDVRVTVVDEAVVAVALHREEAGGEVDIRRDNMRNVHYEPIDIPIRVATGLRRLLASYGLRFAAADFGVTAAKSWVFFEVNPNGQWAWLDLVGVTNLWQDFAHAFEARP